MNPKTYQIAIKGAASGTSPDEVAKNLASLFKITEVQAKNILASGNSIVKKNLPFQDTEKYRLAIEKCGVVACVEPELDSRLEFDLPLSPENTIENSKGATTSNEPENLMTTKNNKLTLRQKINRYGGFVMLGLMGFGLLSSVINPADKKIAQQKQSVSSGVTSDTGADSSCNATKITVGGCLMGAGYDQSDRDWEPLSQLMMNGSGTHVVKRVNGKCIATVHVYGQYKGNSYDKSFSCPIN